MARRPSSRTMPLARRREPAARWRAPRSARRRCAGLHHSRTTPDSERCSSYENRAGVCISYEEACAVIQSEFSLWDTGGGGPRVVFGLGLSNRRFLRFVRSARFAARSSPWPRAAVPTRVFGPPPSTELTTIAYARFIVCATRSITTAVATRAPFQHAAMAVCSTSRHDVVGALPRVETRRS